MTEPIDPEDEVVIAGPQDIAGRDRTVMRLRSIFTESVPSRIDGIELEDEMAFLSFSPFAGGDVHRELPYPVTWSSVQEELLWEDEDGGIRGSAILEWMHNESVPTSREFEAFLRWMVFEDLALDADEISVIKDDGRPLELAVGWHLEPEVPEHRGIDYKAQERTHLLVRKPRTRLVLRYDGWSALLFELSAPIGRGAGEAPPPHFCTARLTGDSQEVRFQNVDASAPALISFYRVDDG